MNMRKTIAFIAVVTAVLLVGCTRTVKTEVKGEQEWRPAATTTTWDEPTTTTTIESVEDRAYSALIDDIPALGGNTRSDVEDLLQTVCDIIDEEDGDFATVGDVIVSSSADNFGFDYGDAGTIVATAVIIRCPEWADAALEFANS